MQCLCYQYTLLCFLGVSKDVPANIFRQGTYESSHLNMLSSQQKERPALSDISNCPRNLTTEFNIVAPTSSFIKIDFVMSYSMIL